MNEPHRITPTMRPLERTVLRRSNEGMSAEEVARRIGRSPETVERVMAMATMHDGTQRRPAGDVLRPLERRVLRWRADGASYEEIALRFLKSPTFIRRVEALSLHKLGGR